MSTSASATALPSSSSSAPLLPQIAAALAQAPAGTNPYAYFADELSWAVYPGIARWSGPVFLALAALSFANIFAVLFAFWIKWRREAAWPRLARWVDHRSGQRFLCVNSTNVFLAFHLLSSMVFTVFPILHVYEYKKPGKTYMDISWAVLMWLAPYIGLLMTCLGALYGVLIPPLSYAQRKPSGELVHSSGTLARLPCWLLNALVVLSPVFVSMSIMIPGIRLIVSVKKVEMVAVALTASLLDAASVYGGADQPNPPLQWQYAALQQVGLMTEYGGDASRRWRPLFGVWLGWSIFSGMLAILSSVVVYKITKRRLQAAQRTLLAPDSEGSQDSVGREKRKNSVDTLVNPARRRSSFARDPESTRQQRAAVERARWDHLNITAQFVLAALLFFVVGVVLVFEVVVGYTVHLRIDLLAVSLLIPIAAYLVQGTLAVGLVIIRNVQGKAYTDKSPVHSTSSASAMSPGGKAYSIFRTISNGGLAAHSKAQTGCIIVRDETDSLELAPTTPYGVQVGFVQVKQSFLDCSDADSVDIVDLSCALSMTPKSAGDDTITDIGLDGESIKDQTYSRSMSSQDDVFGRAL